MYLCCYNGFLIGSSGFRGRCGGRYLIIGCCLLKYEFLIGIWEVGVKFDFDDVIWVEEWGRGGCFVEFFDFCFVSVGVI